MREITVEFIEKLGLDDVESKRRTLVPAPCDLLSEDSGTNISFHYKVIFPASLKVVRPAKRGIMLFHGLNERRWDKYILWAEHLADKTGSPVVLFPLSMHINRAPLRWSDPRDMQREVSKEHGRYLSFVNYAISTRLKADPYRFYLGGRETAYNVWQFIADVKSGNNDLFEHDCHFNIFAYSIGALLSQVLLMGDQYGFFGDSKLFMFCGGALFSEMNGRSKMIMDEEAFNSLHRYYTTEFLNETPGKRLYGDFLEEAFMAHIGDDIRSGKRQLFYNNNHNRIMALSLKNDRVVPTSGIMNALGDSYDKILEEIDFPFDYSHESPFPFGGKGDQKDVYHHFCKLFDRAAAFLEE